MEMSNHSEAEIIKLGKKIVEELQLEPSVNTLGRWMSHYVAELILQAENCQTEDEKLAKQKECCEIILKLWKNREHVPNISTPLSELNPIIDLLSVFVKNEHPLPYFRHFRDMHNDGSWIEFVNTIIIRSKNIFELCLYSQVSSELLNKKQEWLKDHKNMLAKEEIEMLEHLEYLVNRSDSFIVFSNEKEQKILFDELPVEKKYEAIFDKIESEIQDISSKFQRLRKLFLKEMK